VRRTLPWRSPWAHRRRRRNRTCWMCVCCRGFDVFFDRENGGIALESLLQVDVVD
jgi:hypothetical protein